VRWKATTSCSPRWPPRDRPRDDSRTTNAGLPLAARGVE
jgi:hypothetical protein